MYNNLIYFLIVLLVFTTAQPSDRPLETGLLAAVNILPYLVYIFLCRETFRRLARLPVHSARASLAYHRALTRLSVAALGFYAVSVYMLGLKDLIFLWPAAAGSEALSGMIGVAFFALYLVLLWGQAYPTYRRIFRTRLTRRRYVWGQLKFNLPIIAPWLLLSALADLAALLPESNLKRLIDSPTGEVFFFLLFLAVLIVFFPLLIRPMWGLTPLPPGPKRKLIDDFSRRHDFRYREVMLWPLYEGEGLTAGVMGLLPRWRYLLITKALLNVLNDEELEAVLSHEFGHVVHRHLFFYFLFFLGYMALAYAIGDVVIFLLSSSDLVVRMMVESRDRPSTALSLLFSLPSILLMIVYFRFGLGLFLRNFERQADLYAYRVTGTIRGLVGSLEKIAHYSGQSRDLPSWHHYSVGERVDFLLRCRENPSLVAGHQRRVRRLIGTYLAALVLVVGLGAWIQQSGLVDLANQRYAAKAVQHVLEQNPDDPRAHLLLGDLHFTENRHQAAIDAYQRAAALDPDNPEALNNLAWALAVRPEASPDELRRSLDLAGRAARIEPAPYILDTLAEAYFRNGRPRAALAAIEEAIRRAGPGDDKSYLRQQKDRFEAALEPTP